MMPARTLSGQARRCLASLFLVLVVAWAAQPALADDRLHQSTLVWKAIDGCAREATKAYPDYTAESLAKREAQRRLCLRRGNLPGATARRNHPSRAAAARSENKAFLWSCEPLGAGYVKPRRRPGRADFRP